MIMLNGGVDTYALLRYYRWNPRLLRASDFLFVVDYGWCESKFDLVRRFVYAIAKCKTISLHIFFLLSAPAGRVDINRFTDRYHWCLEYLAVSMRLLNI